MNRDSLHTTSVAYPRQSFDAALVAPSNQQLLVHTVSAYNGSVSPMGIGISHSITNSAWQVLVTSSGVQTDKTEDIQNGVATTVLGTATNDSFIVQAKSQFGLLSFNVSQAESGIPVYTYSYFDGAGFSPLTLINSVSYEATGLQCLVFSPPVDWSADDDGFYVIEIKATTATGTAVQIDSLKVCTLLAYRSEIPSKGELQVSFGFPRQLLLQAGEEIIPFFAFSSSSNTMEASYQISP